MRGDNINDIFSRNLFHIITIASFFQPGENKKIIITAGIDFLMAVAFIIVRSHENYQESRTHLTLDDLLPIGTILYNTVWYFSTDQQEQVHNILVETLVLKCFHENIGKTKEFSPVLFAMDKIIGPSGCFHYILSALTPSQKENLMQQEEFIDSWFNSRQY